MRSRPPDKKFLSALLHASITLHTCTHCANRAIPRARLYAQRAREYRRSAYSMPCQRARRRSSRLFAPRAPHAPLAERAPIKPASTFTRARIMHAHIYIYFTRTCACCANCANYTSARTAQFRALSESQKISQKLKTRADMRPSRVGGAESQSGLSEGINCQGMSNLSETAAQSDFIPKVSVA